MQGSALPVFTHPQADINPWGVMPVVFHYELIFSTYNPLNMCPLIERHNLIQHPVTLLPLATPMPARVQSC